MNNRKGKFVGASAFIVVAALIVSFVVIGTNPGGLSGGTVLVITPSNPAVVVGQQVTLSVNPTYACNWFSSNANVSFVGDTNGVKTATVKGDVSGTATIEARCGLLRTNKVYTDVKVDPAPPVIPTQDIGTTNLVAGGDMTDVSVGSMKVCNWSANPGGIVDLSPRDDDSGTVFITPLAAGTTQIKAQCVDWNDNNKIFTGTVIVTNP